MRVARASHATTSMEFTLSAQLEAVLLFRGGAVHIKELATITGSGVEAVEEALGDLKALYDGRGMRVTRDGGRVALSTAPEAAALIETMRRDELDGPLGRAGLETLAIVMYRAPVSRADIEYIRGVNVSSTLRSLMMRGLIERIENPEDARSYLYRPTVELPAYLGVESVDALPDFAKVTEELGVVLAGQKVEPEQSPEEPV